MVPIAEEGLCRQRPLSGHQRLAQQGWNSRRRWLHMRVKNQRLRPGALEELVDNVGVGKAQREKLWDVACSRNAIYVEDI